MVSLFRRGSSFTFILCSKRGARMIAEHGGACAVWNQSVEPLMGNVDESSAVPAGWGALNCIEDEPKAAQEDAPCLLLRVGRSV